MTDKKPTRKTRKTGWKQEWGRQPKRWFKVFTVQDYMGQSGGYYTSPFGTNLNWTVGKWKTQQGPLEMCSSGLHVTPDPLKFIASYFGDPDDDPCVIFEVKVRGIKDYQRDSWVNEIPKAVCRSVKLVRQVSTKILRPLKRQGPFLNRKKA